MKAIGWLFAILLSTSICVANEDLVRVRLLKKTDELTLSGSSIRARGQSHWQKVSLPKANLQRVKIQRVFINGAWVWQMNEGANAPRFVASRFLRLQGEDLRRLSSALPGDLILAAESNKTSSFSVIGLVNMDQYLEGVVASEMPSSWPLETLKAQAVAARSYVLAVMRERKDRLFHVESTVMDQVFRQIKSPQVRAAVEATQGQVVALKAGQPLKAFFHADCGGQTTTAKSVWSAGPSAGVAIDNSCPVGRASQWQLSLSKEELQKHLGFKFEDLQVVKSLGRVQFVELVLPQGEKQKVLGNELRQKIGFDKLKSTMFELRQEGKRFVFSGKGYGHGVGLCQWGSRKLGEQGKSYREILAHYYPLARLEPRRN